MCKQLAGKLQRTTTGNKQGTKRGERCEGQGDAATEVPRWSSSHCPLLLQSTPNFVLKRPRGGPPNIHALRSLCPVPWTGLEPWLGRSQPAGHQGSGYVPFIHKRLCTGLPSFSSREIPGQYRVWEAPPEYRRRKPSAQCPGPSGHPRPSPQEVCMSYGRSLDIRVSSEPHSSVQMGPGTRDSVSDERGMTWHRVSGRPRLRAAHHAPPLTCVYPQVDLQVMRRPEGLPAVRAVLQRRAQAPVTQQCGLLDASGPPCLLADVCRRRHVHTSRQHMSQVVHTTTADTTQS